MTLMMGFESRQNWVGLPLNFKVCFAWVSSMLGLNSNSFLRGAVCPRLCRVVIRGLRTIGTDIEVSHELRGLYCWRPLHFVLINSGQGQDACKRGETAAPIAFIAVKANFSKGKEDPHNNKNTPRNSVFL